MSIFGTEGENGDQADIDLDAELAKLGELGDLGDDAEDRDDFTKTIDDEADDAAKAIQDGAEDGGLSKLGDDAVEVDNDRVQRAVDSLQDKLGRPPTPEEVEAVLEEQLKTEGTPLNQDPLADDADADLDENSIMKDIFGEDLDAEFADNNKNDELNDPIDEDEDKDDEQIAQEQNVKSIMDIMDSEEKAQEENVQNIMDIMQEEEKAQEDNVQNIMDIMDQAQEEEKQAQEENVQNIMDIMQEEEKTQEDNVKNIMDIMGIGQEEEKQEEGGPFTENDAINEIRELTGMTPSNDEVNDWLNEMNAPFSPDYLTDGQDFSLNSGSDIMNYSFFIMLAAMVITGLIWRRNRNKPEDDSMNKPAKAGIFDSLRDPFNRKKDGDDDFDKVL